jgi:hypothetical protein
MIGEEADGNIKLYSVAAAARQLQGVTKPTICWNLKVEGNKYSDFDSIFLANHFFSS